MRIQRLLRCEESKIEFHDDVLIPKYALLSNVHQYYSRRALAVFQYFPQPQSRNSSRSESQSHEKFPISKVRKKFLTQRHKVPPPLAGPRPAYYVELSLRLLYFSLRICVKFPAK